MKCFRLFFSFLLMCSLTHCISYDLSRHIVQQGNLLPQSKVQRLKIGMTKQDVHQLMGSSLVHDIFNTDHVTYAYTWQKGDAPMLIKNVALTFKHDRLIDIQHLP